MLKKLIIVLILLGSCSTVPPQKNGDWDIKSSSVNSFYKDTGLIPLIPRLQTQSSALLLANMALFAIDGILGNETNIPPYYLPEAHITMDTTNFYKNGITYTPQNKLGVSVPTKKGNKFLIVYFEPTMIDSTYLLIASTQEFSTITDATKFAEENPLPKLKITANSDGSLHSSNVKEHSQAINDSYTIIEILGLGNIVKTKQKLVELGYKLN